MLATKLAQPRSVIATVPQPERTAFGEWLYGWRHKRRLTQEQLAQAALTTKRDIERYETKVAPRGDTFLRLLSALGLSVEGMPQGPKAINAELVDLRKEVAALRRSVDRRLESTVETAERLLEGQSQLREDLRTLADALPKRGRAAPEP